jgi:hypothetical protein
VENSCSEKLSGARQRCAVQVIHGLSEALKKIQVLSINISRKQIIELVVIVRNFGCYLGQVSSDGTGRRPVFFHRRAP